MKVKQEEVSNISYTNLAETFKASITKDEYEQLPIEIRKWLTPTQLESEI